MSSKDVSEISRGIMKKYSGVNIAGRETLLFSPEGGALDLKRRVGGLKRRAARRVRRVGKRVKKIDRKRLRRGIRGVRGVARGVGEFGAEVGRVKLEAWKREKLGEYPYGPAYPRPIREHAVGVMYSPQEQLIRKELRAPRELELQRKLATASAEERAMWERFFAGEEQERLSLVGTDTVKPVLMPSGARPVTSNRVLGCKAERTIYPVGSMVFKANAKYYCPRCGRRMPS